MSWIDDRRSGVSSSYGGVRVKGGLLPKKGTIGNIQVCFDEDMPHRSGSRGSTNIYTCDGNLQVFYNRRGDEVNIEWDANIVDIYYFH